MGEVSAAARELRSRGFRSVMFAARGTSDNAALYAKYLFEVILGVPTTLASPSAFTLYESEMKLDDVLVIGISQSGESKDVLATVRRSGELAASTLSVTNEEGSSMAAAAEFHFISLCARARKRASRRPRPTPRSCSYSTCSCRR